MPQCRGGRPQWQLCGVRRKQCYRPEAVIHRMMPCGCSGSNFNSTINTPAKTTGLIQRNIPGQRRECVAV